MTPHPPNGTISEQAVTLHGFHASVYCWVCRMVLLECGVGHMNEAVDPFATSIPARYLERNPFGLVPTLSHGDFVLYETSAITRYVDAEFGSMRLTPNSTRSIARLAQLVAIVDHHAYRPMVRQVFEQRVYRPAFAEAVDEGAVEAGVLASRTVLRVLDGMAAEGLVLNPGQFTLADCYLAPMVAYFIAAPEGRAELGKHSALSGWWASISERPSLVATDPGLPGASP